MGGQQGNISSDAGLSAIALENRIWLEQIHDLLGRITPELYTAAEGPFARGGAGKHIRHVLEHYHALLSARSGTVDYDARERDPSLETDPQAARAYIGSLIDRLDELIGAGSADNELTGEDDNPMTVAYNCDDASYPVTSSLSRELMFLSSHTVHHLALVRFILEYLGQTVPDELGVALSTLRYERQSASADA